MKDTLKEHLRKAAKSRWARMTKSERSRHMSEMAKKRWANRPRKTGP